MIQAEREQIDRIIANATKWIWVTLSREGIHAYPDATTNPMLHDVNFLGYPHRHIFHFKIWIEVGHNDRDIEFIQFKRWLESLYGSKLSLDYKSCEMIAEDLYVQIASKYPGRNVKIDISEDNENGAHLEFNLPEAIKFNATN